MVTRHPSIAARSLCVSRKAKSHVTTSNLSRRRGVRAAAAATTVGLAAASLSLVSVSPAQAATVQVQILATNDFHGRLINEDGTGGTTKGQTAGAAILSGAVKQLTTNHTGPTFFTGAGDLIGASTFESFIQRDLPTLQALNEAGLDVSAAGNHEFDQGYADLVNRVMKPNDAANPEGGANWQYLAANVRKKSDNSYALPDVAASPGTSDGATWMQTVNGIDVGFIGAVTEDLPSLVSPSGIADLKVTSIIDEVNTAADQLTSGGADVVVLLMHEGASDTTLATASNPANAFGKIVTSVNANVDAVVSGHTHLAYNHTINNRPVVSAGQYGMALNKLVFSVDDTNGAISGVTSTIEYLKDPTRDAQGNCICTPLYPADPVVAQIVADAKAKAEVLGAVPLGQVAAGHYRARLADGTTENRGGESTLGNLVAEVQRWATSSKEAGEAQIAFMNPGGLRTDMLGSNAAGYPATLTYKQAAVVQPFANTLVNMKLTGAQIKTVLEQQWQRDSRGQIPSRPFLRLGTSKGFLYTYDPDRPEGDRITGMWLDGKAIATGSSYSVTVNSFLAAGGDNFRELANGTAKRDTGKVDLEAMVDYMKQYPAGKPLAVDYQQHSVAVQRPATAPRFYRVGERVQLKLASLAMTAPTDKKDAKLVIKSGESPIGSVSVDNSVGTAVFDEYGKSTVDVKLTRKAPIGKGTWKLVGDTTGSTFELPVEIRKAKPTVKVKVKPRKKVKLGKRLKLKVKVAATGLGKVNGTVKVKVAGKTFKGKLKKGKVVFKLKTGKLGKAGKKKVRVVYTGKPYARKVGKTVRIKLLK